MSQKTYNKQVKLDKRQDTFAGQRGGHESKHLMSDDLT